MAELLPVVYIVADVGAVGGVAAAALVLKVIPSIGQAFAGYLIDRHTL